MRRSPLALLGLVLAAALAASGCAPRAATPDPTRTAEAAPTVEPSPTIEPLVIGPAEMPPVAFGGDCSKTLSNEDLAEWLGTGVTPERGTGQHLAAMGGLECTWPGPNGASVRLEAIPRAGLSGAEFPDEHAPSFFANCSYDGYCSWQGGDDALWLALTFHIPEIATSQDAAAAGEALGAKVIESHDAVASQPWTQDTTGWIVDLGCERIAAAVGAQFGQPLEGQEFGWDADRPPAAYVMAIASGRQALCRLRPDEPDGSESIVRVFPGLGALAFDDAVPVDLGIAGVIAFKRPGAFIGEEWMITDGVNRIEAFLPRAGATTPDPLAVAVAAAAASGFE